MKANLPVKKHENGQSFVELALILPLLFVLMAGVIDLGRFFLSYMELRDAAQEGANYASIYQEIDDSTFVADVQNRVRASAKYPMDLSDITVSVTPASSRNTLNVGSNIKVTVDYNFAITTPFVGIFFQSQILPMSANMTSVVLVGH